MEIKIEFAIRMLLFLSLVANGLFIAAGSDAENRVKTLLKENKELRERIWRFHNVENQTSTIKTEAQGSNDRIRNKMFRLAYSGLQKIRLL